MSYDDVTHKKFVNKDNNEQKSVNNGHSLRFQFKTQTKMQKNTSKSIDNRSFDNDLEH